MSFADRTLTCRDCGQAFVFTSGEQDFFAQKGFTNDPSRCPTCRAATEASGVAEAGATAAATAGVATTPIPTLRRLWLGRRLWSPGAPVVLGDLLDLRPGGAGAVPAARRSAGVLLGLLHADTGIGRQRVWQSTRLPL